MISRCLPLAIRALALPATHTKRRRRTIGVRDQSKWPDYVLIFDTETTIDRTQRLLFGCYRVGKWDTAGRLEIVEEGLLYGDDLPARDPSGFACLKRYASASRGDVSREYDATLHLRSRSEFAARVLYPWSVDVRALVVGFNLPFDLSRIAVRASAGRQQNRKAFSLIVFDKDGRESQYRPRIRVTSRNNRSAFIVLGRVRSPQGRPYHAGRFLDLRTLTHALTNESHSLASACNALGVAHGKGQATAHGVVTSDYIEYNRRDVLASQELLERLREEFDRHPLPLQPDKAYSPASIAKAYLDAMGVQPLATKSTLTRHQIGAAMSGYYGGRAECHVRRTPVPVLYLDFLSMYPTVNCLLGLWKLHVARDVGAEDATKDVRRLLQLPTLAKCFDPALWKRLNFFAQVHPNQDVLPVRAQYGADCAFGIGLNPLVSQTPLWYAGPDLVAATLLSGRPPKVIRAFKIVPNGQQEAMAPVSIRGMVRVDPSAGDFFRHMVELRKSVSEDRRVADEERDWLRNVLKTMNNSGAYGILAELNRQDHRKPSTITVYAGRKPFRTETSSPEKVGRFCYPPLAALITAGARLMLALLEREVTDRGGTYAFCDTDSMAVISKESGGLVHCSGGSEHMADGRSAIRALSWTEVDAIVRRFTSLSPYDRRRVPGSILEIEDVNVDPETGKRREIEAFAISAKRYALFVRSRSGRIAIVDYKEHGLGHLLNPLDPDARERGSSPTWIRELWQYLIERALDRNPREPRWLDRPALSRIAVTAPDLLKTFATLNDGRRYCDQVKPYNFVLAAHVRAFGHPSDADPTRFQLIAPFEPDPRKWADGPWVNRYGGGEIAITTVGDTGGPGLARLATYRDVLAAYETHPEVKSLGPDAQPCGRHTVGHLQRRPVLGLWVVAIGKESNKLEDVEAGLEHDWSEVVNLYANPVHEWQRTMALLQKAPRRVIAGLAGISTRRVTAIRRGYENPRAATRRALTQAVAEWAANIVTRGADVDNIS